MIFETWAGTFFTGRPNKRGLEVYMFFSLITPAQVSGMIFQSWAVVNVIADLGESHIEGRERHFGL